MVKIRELIGECKPFLNMTAAALWLPFGLCTLSTCNARCTLHDFTCTGKTKRTIFNRGHVTFTQFTILAAQDNISCQFCEN